MPELPEVETVRRSLEPALLGRTIARVSLKRPDIVQGRRTPADLLSGRRITDIQRRGKQLALIAEDRRAVCIHLGMSGQLLAISHATPLARNDHVHIQWRLAEGRNGSSAPAGRLVFRDPRRFGGVWTFPTLDHLLESRWSALGPDAASLTTAQLAAALAPSRRPVKALLLDQTAIAGLGNIYADEALHAARIRPDRPSHTITPEETARLTKAIRATLAQAIKAGGSTLRDYVDSQGQSGWFQRQHAVYARAGQPCRSCASPLSSGLLAQRTTVWCDVCQQ
ncbi:MAG: bifunctional DNA-formamidopyrimidine glycosylase/DNA-(apurinic or apyrimidinic site) lyase [Planctomycetota bacterium]|nr:bifunctional DNA-formamidopyrimidine glycosylase/DNA-(apurinic or apyrimidinic site) lyase [Planctomycetota bacterium]